MTAINMYASRIGVIVAGCLLAVGVACSSPASSTSPASSQPAVTSAASAQDPLPSWQDTAVRRTILDFVVRVTRDGSPDFVPPADRVATFDNDGTLWVERPLPVELAFVGARVRELVEKTPALAAKQPYKAAIERDVEYFHHEGAKAVVELLTAAETGTTQEVFQAQAKQFFATARHPTLDRPFTELVYQPMIELLAYLRAHGFQIWICSGGTIDFMRAVVPSIYGIPEDHIIGSELKRDSRMLDSRRVVFRLPGIDAVNDKETKPVGIDRHIGRRPLFVAGNVGNAGDIAMMEYGKGRQGASLQLLVNHDDADREFAYVEVDGFSLNAAKTQGFTVVSIKQDWKTVFPPRK